MPLEVTVDEWTPDTDENRRLRAATRRLLLVNDLPELVRRRLSRIDRQLADVQLLPMGGLVPSWTPTRLECPVHPLLRLADLVLSGSTVEHRLGGVQVRGFVLSMATLFERLVTGLLRELRAGGAGFRSVSLPLDRDAATDDPSRSARARHGDVVAVADVKYKLLDDNSLSQS